MIRGWRWLLPAVLAAAIPCLVGCPRGEDGQAAAVRENLLVESPPDQYEVIAKIKENMVQLITLKAEVDVTKVVMTAYEPASWNDRVLMTAGKTFRKVFTSSDLRGVLFIDRRPDSARRIKFYADWPGSDDRLLLVGIGKQFWVAQPEFNSGPYRTRIFKGELDWEYPRPAFAMRPQDIADLLLYDELFLNSEVVKSMTFMETWPDFYIITVLRLDRPALVASRIWVNRQTMQVAYHQLFDSDGRIMAEAQFRDYQAFTALPPEPESPRLKSDREKVVYVPLTARVFWPRDEVVLDVTLRRVAPNFIPSDMAGAIMPPSEDNAIVETLLPARPFDDTTRRESPTAPAMLPR